jgi:NitT/TauT family transport system permease protein
MNSRAWRWCAAFGGPACAFALSETASRSGLVDLTYLPPPTVVAAALPDLMVHGPLWRDLLASLSAVAIGVTGSTLLGVAMAVLARRFPVLRWVVTPIIELMRGLAPLALLPAFLLIFGLGQASEIAIIVWVAWVPVYINSLEGLDETDSELLLAARTMGASFGQLLVSVYLPSVSGHLLSGLRLAFGNAWLAVVAAEMLGSNRGLGYRILEYSQTFRIADMYAAILVIGGTSLGINAVLLVTYRRFTRWRVG